MNRARGLVRERQERYIEGSLLGHDHRAAPTVTDMRSAAGSTTDAQCSGVDDRKRVDLNSTSGRSVPSPCVRFTAGVMSSRRGDSPTSISRRDRGGVA
jgi:hypothetical protein